MSAPIKTLVAIDANIDHDAVHASLPIGADIEIVGVVDGLDHSWTTLQETATDLLVVACAGDSDRALFLIENAVKQRPDRPVVVFTGGSPNGFVRRAFAAGADDIVALPESPETVRFALEKAVARKRGAAAASAVATAPLICVLGPKGGTGKTLTTCNLAVALASAGHRVAVVDLDLQFGDVGLSLGLAPERTIYDLAKSGGSLDTEKLDGYLARHPSGARVLVAPARPDHAGAVTVQFLHEVFATLRVMHDFVLVDTPPGFTPEVIATIDSATHLCVVGMLDSLSLKNTKLGLETLELMGYEADRVTLVLNRADTRVGITSDDVYDIVGRRPDVLVPSDRDVSRAVNGGRPIVLEKPRSDAAKAFRELSSRYVAASQSGDGNGASARKRGRLLKRKG